LSDLPPATPIEYRDLSLLREGYSVLQVWKSNDNHA
jgi:hypothetical protein